MANKSITQVTAAWRFSACVTFAQMKMNVASWHATRSLERSWNPVKLSSYWQHTQIIPVLIKFFFPFYFSFVPRWRSCSRQWLYSWMVYCVGTGNEGGEPIYWEEWKLREQFSLWRWLQLRLSNCALSCRENLCPRLIVIPHATGIVSNKRGLPFHRCPNGFLTNKIG